MGMQKDMKFIVGITLLALLILLILNKIRPAVLFGFLAAFYYVIGYIDFNAWIISYTNNSLIALILLLLVSFAIERTSFVEYISNFIIQKSYNFSILKLGIIVCTISAFLNNTAVVASLMGAINNNKFHAPSKLLLPLSYFAVVGGVLTLIGTSTNLVINSFVTQNGLDSLKMFDFFYVGVILAIGMILTLMIFSGLLPNYKHKENDKKQHLIALKVADNSTLIGKSVKENNLRHLDILFLTEIQRGEETIVPVSRSEIIKSGDILIFSGDITRLDVLKNIKGLTLIENKATNEKIDFIDVVLKPNSNLIGKNAKEVNFRTRFDAAIISMQRGDNNIKKIGQTTLQAGDRMILATGKDFNIKDNASSHFYFLSKIKQEYKLDNKNSIFVIIGFLSVVICSALGLLSFVKSLLIYLGTLLVFRLISLDDIKRRFPFDIFIIIGSSLAITKVLISSGLANDLSSIITHSFGTYGVYGSFIGIFLLTLFLTEFITNNAAAALVFPIAFATAQSLNVNPLPFIFAVAYGASAAFMIPYGYQTHLMVSSICNYKTTDFIKIGWMVSLVYSCIVIYFVPIVFKF